MNRKKKFASFAISRSYIIDQKGLLYKKYVLSWREVATSISNWVPSVSLVPVRTFNGVGDYLLWVVTRLIIRVVCTAMLIEMEPAIQQNGFRSILKEPSIWFIWIFTIITSIFIMYKSLNIVQKISYKKKEAKKLNPYCLPTKRLKEL